MSDPDADLLTRYVRKDDRRALATLFERYAGEAFALARAILRDPGSAEDAAQQAFLDLMRLAATFDPARPFRPWMRALVSNAALKELRAGRRRVHREEAADLLPHATEDPAMRLEADEMRARLWVEVDALPEELRLPVVLHYRAGMPYAEVARQTGCPEGTVATRLSTARSRLKERLALAGVLLATEVALEDVLAGEAPVAGAPAGLLQALQEMAASPPLPGKALSVFPSKSFLLASSAALLLALVVSVGVWRPRPPAGPRVPPATDTTSVTPGRPAVPEPSCPTEADPPGEGAVPAVTESKGATLFGQVTCLETGQPIVDASVSCMTWFRARSQLLEPEDLLARSVKTDTEGRYQISTTPHLKAFTLHVDAPGFAGYHSSYGHALVPPFETPDKKPVLTALSDGEERRIDVALLRGEGLLVRLRGLDGVPLPEAKVTLRTPETVLVLDMNRSGAEWRARKLGTGRSEWEVEGRRGHKSFGPPPPYECPLEVGVHPDGYLEVGGLDPARLPPQETEVEVQAPGFLPKAGILLGNLPNVEGRRVLDVTLARGRTVEGHVETVERGYVEVYALSIRPREGPAGTSEAIHILQKVRAGDGGMFRLQGLPEQEAVFLWAQFEDSSGRRHETRDAAMDGFVNADDAPPLLRLDASGEVSGQVVDERGDPLRRIRVWGTYRGDLGRLGVEREADTDADGRFTLRNLPSRWRDLTIRAADTGIPEKHHPRGIAGVPAGVDDLRIVLPSCGEPPDSRP